MGFNEDIEMLQTIKNLSEQYQKEGRNLLKELFMENDKLKIEKKILIDVIERFKSRAEYDWNREFDNALIESGFQPLLKKDVE